jgi:hypothetical protein
VAIIIIALMMFTGTTQTTIPSNTPYGFRGSSGNSGSGFERIGLIQSGVDRDVSCSPSSGYNKCFAWEKTEESGGDAVARAYVEIQANDVPVGNKKGDYYVGDVYIPYKFTGDKFFYTKNVGSWDNLWNSVAKCNEQGCSGQALQREGKLYLAHKGEEFKDCIVFYAWDYNRVDSEDGSWAWVWKAGGWGWNQAGNCFNIKSVACYDDNDCSEGKYCDKSGDWKTWACQDKVTYYRYSNESNSCSSVVLAPSQVTGNDFTTQVDCEKNIKHPEYVIYAIIGVVGIALIILIVYLIRRKLKK